MDGAAKRNALADMRDAVALSADHDRQRAAIAFTHSDNHFALAGLFFRNAAINSLAGLVLRFDVASKISAIDRNSAG